MVAQRFTTLFDIFQVKELLENHVFSDNAQSAIKYSTLIMYKHLVGRDFSQRQHMLWYEDACWNFSLSGASLVLDPDVCAALCGRSFFVRGVACAS